MLDLFRELDNNSDYSAQWEAIDRFVRDWLNVEFSRDARASEIDEVAGEHTLPLSVREWIAFALASQRLGDFTFRDCLVVEQVCGHDALSLLIQGESDFYWAIESQYLNQPNPPVAAYRFNYDSEKTVFEAAGMWAPTVTSFALDYFLSYLHSPGGGFAIRQTSEYFNRNELESDFGDPVHFGHLELFHSDGVLAVLGGLPPSWHHNVLNVEVQTKRSFKHLPASIQTLVKGSHITRGGMHKNR